jgi:hypothetical protein
MSDRECLALSQAIRATVQRDGNYGAIVRGAGVSQPFVSLALHRRLVVKTEKIGRLFEYLQLSVDSEPAVDKEVERAERIERLLTLVDGLGASNGASHERICALFAALGNLFQTNETALTEGVSGRD